MKRICVASVFMVATLALHLSGGQVEADGHKDWQGPSPYSRGFSVSYAESKVSKNRNWYASNHLFEPMVDALNSAFKPSSLPVNVEIVAADCGQENAFYNPDTHQVRICYELLDMIVKTSSSLSSEEGSTGNDGLRLRMILGASRFIMLHEVGHSFQYLLNRGATGNLESGADYFAAIVAIFSGDESTEMAFWGAYLFSMLSKNERLDFSDEHPPSLERANDILCLIYGSNPASYPEIAKVLGDARSPRCQSTFEVANKAWQREFRRFLANGN